MATEEKAIYTTRFAFSSVAIIFCLTAQLISLPRKLKRVNVGLLP
jgi:hypothetical protein